MPWIVVMADIEAKGSFDDDREILARLGKKQVLKVKISGFSALYQIISLTILSATLGFCLYLASAVRY